MVSAHAQNCFTENLVNNFLKKHSMTFTGVTTVANEIYFVHLNVCRKPFIVNYDVLCVADFLKANFCVQPIFLFCANKMTKKGKTVVYFAFLR